MSYSTTASIPVPGAQVALGSEEEGRRKDRGLGENLDVKL